VASVFKRAFERKGAAAFSHSHFLGFVGVPESTLRRYEPHISYIPVSGKLANFRLADH